MPRRKLTPRPHERAVGGRSTLHAAESGQQQCSTASGAARTLSGEEGHIQEHPDPGDGLAPPRWQLLKPKRGTVTGVSTGLVPGLGLSQRLIQPSNRDLHYARDRAVVDKAVAPPFHHQAMPSLWSRRKGRCKIPVRSRMITRKPTISLSGCVVTTASRGNWSVLPEKLWHGSWKRSSVQVAAGGNPQGQLA